MIDPKVFDDLARRVSAAVPQGVREVQGDVERNLRAALQAALNKLDLVTREEYDVQQAVLARSRAKLDELAIRVAVLEERLGLRPVAVESDMRPLDETDMDGG
ncbi:MAG: ubiquinone biosynthesis accessory factor UbiK [Anaerolineae bacterium]